VGITLECIHIDIDMTVETVYGLIQGAKRGHNPWHRGKKGLRPVLAFIAETREYPGEILRRGEAISGQEVARLILSFRKWIPSGVKRVPVRWACNGFSAWVELLYGLATICSSNWSQLNTPIYYNCGANSIPIFIYHLFLTYYPLYAIFDSS
jgi:hypothetical protein